VDDEFDDDAETVKGMARLFCEVSEAYIQLIFAATPQVCTLSTQTQLPDIVSLFSGVCLALSVYLHTVWRHFLQGLSIVSLDCA